MIDFGTPVTKIDSPRGESIVPKSIIIDGIGWYVYEPVCKRRLV